MSIVNIFKAVKFVTTVKTDTNTSFSGEKKKNSGNIQFKTLNRALLHN